jgi:hypothetical protein
MPAPVVLSGQPAYRRGAGSPAKEGSAMDTNRIVLIVVVLAIVGALAWYFYPTMMAPTTTTPAPPAKTEPKK